MLAIALGGLQSCTFIKINTHGNGVSWMGEGEAVEASDLIATKDYVVDNFSGIDFQLAGDIDYKVSDSAYVTVSGPDNYLEIIKVETVGDVLVISCEEKLSIRKNKLKFTIGSSTLTELSIKGAGDVNINDCITTDHLDIKVAGAGDIKVDGLNADSFLVDIAGAGDVVAKGIDCGKVTVDVKGAGDVTLSGKAKKADLAIKGAGDIKIKDLDVDDVKTDVKGIGRIERN